jgi:hypothetical protein
LRGNRAEVASGDFFNNIRHKQPYDASLGVTDLGGFLPVRFSTIGIDSGRSVFQ